MRDAIRLLYTLMLLLVVGEAKGQSAASFFIENIGQWPEDVRLMASVGGLEAWVTDRGIVYDFYRYASEADRKHGASTLAAVPEISRNGHVVRMTFVGSGGRARGDGSRRAPGYYNYLRGSDTTKWARHVPLFREASIDNLYEGVDVRLMLEGGGLRYDLIVSPGADPSAVKIDLEGATSVKVDQAKGELVIETSIGEVRQGGLFAYQDIGSVRRKVACEFRQNVDGSIGFALGEYDRSRELVVDPLVYSTYLGSSFIDYGYGFAVDAGGHAYAGGMTLRSDYPTTPGGYDRIIESSDMMLSKLSSDGTRLIYSTFLGGKSGDVLCDLVIGRQGEVCGVGVTDSYDFPRSSNAYDRVIEGSNEIAVFRLSPDGSTLLGSTFLGGSGVENVPSLAIDSSGNLYVKGFTSSLDFPVTPGAWNTDSSWEAGHSTWYWESAFLSKISPDLTSLVYSTFIPATARSNSGDGATSSQVAVDRSGAAYLIGTIWGADAFQTMPDAFQTTPGAFDPSYNGGTDAYLLAIDATGSSLIFSTFLGGLENDEGVAVAIGPDGDLYVTGRTKSTDFPATPGSFQPSNARPGEDEGFVARFDPTGRALRFASYLGGTLWDRAYDIAVDGSGNILVTGTTGSSNFPVTSNALDGVFADGPEATDAFVSMFSPDGARLIMSTFIGGLDDDRGTGIAIGVDRSIHVAGTTRSPDFSTTDGAYDRSLNGDNAQNLFLLKIGRECTVALSAPADTTICAGSSLVLEAAAYEGEGPYTYVWKDDQGQLISTDSIAVIAATSTRRYIVVAHDNAGCTSEPDTVLVLVLPRPSAVFSGSQTSCVGAAASFTISSFTSIPESLFQIFVDDTPISPARVIGSVALPFTIDHTFTTPGVHTVKLVIWNLSTRCSDTSTATVTVVEPQRAGISPRGITMLCEGDSVRYSASPGFREYRWSTGETTQQITVRAAGEYWVETIDANGCLARSDTARVTLVPRPAAPSITRRGDTLYSTPAPYYQWYRGGSMLAGEIRQWILPSGPGSYSVKTGPKWGCSSFSQSVVIGRHRVVWLDTVQGRVGERLALIMRIEPPLTTEDNIRGFTARLGIDPKALFIHEGRSPDFPAAADPQVTREQAGATIVLVRDGSAPLLGDSILFTLDLEGLVTGQPLNVVRIESVVANTKEDLEVLGNGLVILDGCAISREFGRRARLIQMSPNPAGAGGIAVRWRAPSGAEALLRLVDASGREIWSGMLPAGTDAEQERGIPLDAPSGIYMLQLIEGDETMALPLIISR